MSRFSICQKSEYVRSLNVAGFWICQVSEYTRVLNIPGFRQSSECVWISLDTSWICLIMSQYDRMLNTNSTLLRPASVRSQFPIFENSAKKNLHYFRKTFCRRCLTGLWICLRSWIHQGSEYGSGFKYAIIALHIPLFWIYQGFEYARMLNISGFWICQGSKYTRVLNMPGLWIYQCYEYVSVLNMLGF